MRVSSSPSAKTSEILAVSASMSAWPQRRTDALTGCQLHPSSEATSLTGRPQPAWRVAQRPARDVNRSRGGAISRACSVTVPAQHPERGQRHRRLCHTSRTDRPNAGRSTNSTARSPSDHNAPPQPSHGGLSARRRMCTRSGAFCSSSTPSTSTSPSPTNNSQTRVGSHSTGILQILGCLSAPILGDPSRSAADPYHLHSDLKREEPVSVPTGDLTGYGPKCAEPDNTGLLERIEQWVSI